jgi:hypothetical protein
MDAWGRYLQPLEEAPDTPDPAAQSPGPGAKPSDHPAPEPQDVFAEDESEALI